MGANHSKQPEEPDLPLGPEESAEFAGLTYMDDQTPGYTRKPWGKGFTYLDPKGRHINNPKLRERLEALVIPPAWTEVWISTDPNGHIQATGRDAKGRKQYIYHPRWEEIRNQTKFNRMQAFGATLPNLRKQVDQDLSRRDLSLEKVAAIAVRLLEATQIRIGNPAYTRQNQSYGLTTLRNRHLEISGSKMRFVFRGKSGKDREIDIKDRRLARMVKRMQELPGQALFQYIDEQGEIQIVSSEMVNDYLRKVAGESFSAKDFRTWFGTIYAITELAALGPPDDEADARRKIVQAVKAVAATLGNTPAVCRKYYIHPEVLEAYKNGALFEALGKAEKAAPDRDGLDIEEVAFLTILRQNHRA